MPAPRPASLRRGSNLPHVADFNATVILDAVRRSRTGISRSELGAQTGLTFQTVSNITRRLMEQNLLVEAGKDSSGPGKPRTLLRLDTTSRYSIGIHIDPAVLTYVLLDLSGDVVARVRQDLPGAVDPAGLVDTCARTVADLVRDAQIDPASVVGIGIASPGPIDVARGIVVDPPHLPGWHRVHLRDDLAAATGLPVTLDKDVIAAAVAERWAGAAGDSSNFVFVYLGTGLGIGFVVDDIVVRGSSGNAGDVGHHITGQGDRVCRCGQRGCRGQAECLGVVCSPATLVAEAIAAGVLDPRPGDEDPVGLTRRFPELCAAAAAQDERAAAILDRSARRLAEAIDQMCDMLDPDLVVVGGTAWTPAEPHYLPSLQENVNALFAMSDIHGVAVTGTAIGEDVAAVGAGCLVLDATYSARPASLLLH
ncbi:MAG TPA: ROK family transcriptional regulator [Cellulomonas sp.]